MSSGMAHSYQTNILSDVDNIVSALNRCGYFDFLGNLNPLTPMTGYAAAAHIVSSGSLPKQLSSTVEFCLLGKKVHMNRLPDAVRDICDHLAEEGVALIENDIVSLPMLSIWRYLDLSYFCERPNRKMLAYFGDDSVGLAHRILPNRNESCIDLCSGPGIQSLIMARRSRHVTSVEINPLAQEIARLNARLNGINNIDFVNGDLFEGLTGSYDYLVANPPLVPVPKEIGYAFVGDGGADGFVVVRKILADAMPFLSNSGRGSIIGMSYICDKYPIFVAELEVWAKSADLDVEVYVTSRSPAKRGHFIFDSLCISHMDHTPEERVAELYIRDIENFSATHFCTYAIQFRKGSGRVRLVDFTNKDTDCISWFI